MTKFELQNRKASGKQNDGIQPITTKCFSINLKKNLKKRV